MSSAHFDLKKLKVFYNIIMSVITFEDIKTLPKRRHFLISDEVKEINNYISKGLPINFLPTSHWDYMLPIPGQRKYTYALILFGILESGERAVCIVDGIKPYFEVRVPEGKSPTDFHASLISECKAANLDYESMKITQGKTMDSYDDHADFIHITFRLASQRKNAINFLHHKYKTYHNDTTDYAHVVCRDHETSLSDWCTLSNYSCSKDDRFKCANTFHVQIDGWKPFTGDKLAIPRLKFDKTMVVDWDIETDDVNSRGDVPRPESPTANMFMLSMNFAWLDSDIMPIVDPFDEKYNYPKPRGYLVTYCLSLIPLPPLPNRVCILCKDHSQIVLGWAFIMGLMLPEYRVDFNGSNYDDYWLATLIVKLGLIDAVEKYVSIVNLNKVVMTTGKKVVHKPEEYFYYRACRLKISAEVTVTGRQLAYPGYECIDMMSQLRCINSNPQQFSLNYFLGQYKLGSKVDMPIKVMSAIRRHAGNMLKLVAHAPPSTWDTIMEFLGLAPMWQHTLRLCAVVAEYCICDSARCHDLLTRITFIRDKRAMAHDGYVSMNNAINKANGVKVRNIIANEATRRSIRMNMLAPSYVEEGKYPGALVIDPVKGVHKPRMRPDECISENSKPRFVQWKVGDWERIIPIIREHWIFYDKMNADGQRLINALPEYFREWFKSPHSYPIGGLDFASLYPNIIMAFNLSPEMHTKSFVKAAELIKSGASIKPVEVAFNERKLQAWFVRHSYTGAPDEKRGVTADDVKNNFGIFPSCLDRLFKRRKQMKALLKPYAMKKEHLELLSAEEFKTRKEEYDDVVFTYKYLDSSQKSAKIFMNTFYGETGNARSPICVRELAGGVTTEGQALLGFGCKVVKENGGRVRYGDTDSIYVEADAELFRDLDISYYCGDIDKETYMREIVNRNFRWIENMKRTVNAAMMDRNKSQFLNMEYEELLYPTVLNGKKKYFGRAHIGDYNPNPKALFERGSDAGRKGTNKVLVDVIGKLAWSLCNPYCHDDILEMANDIIKDLYTRKHDPAAFIKSAQYKPNKQNVAVQTYVKRMQDRGMVIEPFSRISYLIPQGEEYKYDIRGRRKLLTIGERMEPADEVIAKGLPIDVDYYILNTIVAPIARMLHWHPQFRVSWSSPEEYDAAEEQAIKSAKNHIETEAAKLAQRIKPNSELVKGIFKHTNAAFVTKMGSIVGSSNDVLQMVWNVREGKKPVRDQIYQELTENLEKSAKKEAKTMAKKMLKTIKGDMGIYRKAMFETLEYREKIFGVAQINLTSKLRDLVGSLNNMLTKRDAVLTHAATSIRESIGATPVNIADLRINDHALSMIIGGSIRDNWTERDIEILHKISLVVIELKSQMTHVMRIRELNDLILAEITKSQPTPSRIITENLINQCAARLYGK